MLAPPYDIPVLRSARLELRPWRPDDAPAMMRLAGDREVAETTLNLPHPYPLSAAEQFIAQHPEMARSGAGLVWALTIPGVGPVGSASIVLTPAHHRGELGYWLGLEHWNRGYMTEAVGGIVRHAFETLGLRRIAAHAMVQNVASWRVMEKVGMRREGLLRQHIQRDGRFEDLVAYGLLVEEWRGTA